jgi:hypothetical protein
MSVAILIERSPSITLEEWRSLIAADSDLRMRTEPYFAANPRTGASIQLPLGEADSEIHEDGEWLPFLRWQRGRLAMEYRDEFEDPTNPARRKLVALAKELRAILGTDAGDEALEW